MNVVERFRFRRLFPSGDRRCDVRWLLCSHAVSQAPQHFRSSETQGTKERFFFLLRNTRQFWVTVSYSGRQKAMSVHAFCVSFQHRATYRLRPLHGFCARSDLFLSLPKKPSVESFKINLKTFPFPRQQTRRVFRFGLLFSSALNPLFIVCFSGFVFCFVFKVGCKLCIILLCAYVSVCVLRLE